MLRFDGSEATRSVQLYGTDPHTLGEAVRYLVDEVGVDHVDMNFGCPVPKVTRKGGGSALPVHRTLLRDIVRAAVAAAGAGPGHHQVPDGRRRRDPHLPRHRPHRRGGGRGGDRAPRPHRRAALQRLGPLGCHRRPQGPRHHDPGARQRRHLGGARRPRHARPDRLRRRGGGPRLPRAPVALPRPRRRLRRPRGAAAAPPRVGRARSCATTPPASSTGAARSAA